jgi:hypothetical protein
MAEEGSELAGPPRRIAFVVTRELSESVGRVNTIRAHLKALRDLAEVEVIALPTATADSRIMGLIRILIAFVGALLMGRPAPLQVLLYSAGPGPRAVLGKLKAGRFDTVVFDMIRCERLIRLCVDGLPGVRLVADMDDLLSRRLAMEREASHPMSLGMAASQLPGVVGKLLSLGVVTRTLSAYESWTLCEAERAVVALTACTILVSPVERSILAGACGPDLGERIRTIFPTVPIRRASERSGPMVERCIFVGGDHQQQNFLALEFLTKLWRDYSPAIELHVYGRKSRPWPPTAGVFWHGYTQSLADAYQPGSLALAPTFRIGGIKTKVLEAWSYGIPVALNEEALQGIGVKQYPLVFSEDGWVSLFESPGELRAAAACAVDIGQGWLELNCSEGRNRRAWGDILALEVG